MKKPSSAKASAGPKNPLLSLRRDGVSVWSDYIRRGWLCDGSLRRLIEADSLGGLTSNPTIFDKAIAGSADYDKSLEPLALADRSVTEIFESLAIEDLQMSADLFLPLYEKTQGADGFVSLEVPPQLARQTEQTVAAARRLWGLVARPNLMIKVPGTAEGLPAIEQLIADGLNINVTLLFSVDRYKQVQEAYVKGLERLAAAGKPLGNAGSVASFFVSRVDTLIDSLLEEKIKAADPKSKKELQALLGKAAIANAKLAYAEFQKVFGSERFLRLKAKGARPQRVLWASTSTKNPAYRDVIYVEDLIGRDTVNTMPLATIDAFRDHGIVKETLEGGLDEARQVFQDLARAGISIDAVTRKLEEDGVASFTASYDSMLKSIQAKREAMRAAASTRAPWRDDLDTALSELQAARFGRRLWKHDPTLWTQDPAHQKLIGGRLGWLNAPAWAEQKIPELQDFAAEVRADGFKTAVLLGMGGSSLAPEVYSRVFGPAKGSLKLIVLDTTETATIRSIEKSLDLKKTLFLVSSKSGSTLEVQSLLHFFKDKLAKKVKKPGVQFVAVTDPGTVLQTQAKRLGFRACFINPADIGGRYSALSYFGLVPAALLGIDLNALLARARVMADRCAFEVPARENPGIELGATLAVLGRLGKDKVTFVTSPALAPFGDWAEQLIAESTGKEGKELLPVVNEPPAELSQYGADRAFVFLGLENDKALWKRADEYSRAGRPVVPLRLKDALDLGGEFFRWEIATVTAGALLGIDAFDEPNVQESKDNTAALLKEFEKNGKLPQETPSFQRGGVTVYVAAEAQGDDLASILERHVAGVKPNDYIALTAYLERTPATQRALETARTVLRDAFKAAVTVGYGPRFLHSTGQLHKGGANNGVFLQLTADEPRELPIPGSPYGFETLIAAQALGDLRALRAKGRRVLRVHFSDPAKGLKSFNAAIAAAVKTAAHA